MGPVYANQRRGQRGFTTEDVGPSGHSENLSSSTQKQSGTTLDIVVHRAARMCNMTFEESGGENSSERFARVSLLAHPSLCCPKHVFYV